MKTKHLGPTPLSLLLFLTVALGLAACSQNYIGSESAEPGAAALPGLYNQQRLDGMNSGATLGLPGIEEEIWVIARPEEVETQELDEPGTGCLLARPEGLEQDVPVPLKHTSVEARVSGFVATVDVTQEFHNPFDVKIEATYTFPLPQNAAVHEFVMQIGERRIRGLIREREEAERTYLEARRQGYTASLLTQERPNVFTQAVANIEPGVSIDVDIRYIHTLTHHDGWFEYRFPMVVAPRYNPAGSTDGIGAVPRGSQGASGQSTEVAYLRPEERSGHDISLAVDLETGLLPEELHSPSHHVQVVAAGETGARVELRQHDSIPNRDFVLRYRLGGDRVRAALMTSHLGEDGYFALMILPPEGLAALPRQALELVFVIDRSGSMKGESMELTRRAVRRALGQLEAGDSFNLITFANDTSAFQRSAVPASEANLEAALRYLERIDAGGGTEMLGAVREAFPGRGEDSERLRCVAFLTDGHVGNEAQVLERLSRDLGSSRVFSFAIGSASNQYLAESMARLGRGAVAFIGQGDDPERVMTNFLTRVTRPALQDVAVDWGGLDVAEVFPARLPDLYAGRPVIATGRFRGENRGDLRLLGSLGGRAQELALDAAWETSGQPGISLVWARKKLAELTDEALVHGRAGEATFRREVLDLALEHGLLSDFTAFLAVDSSRRTEGDHGVSVQVPVPVPEGMRYETTVGGDGR